MRIAIVGASGRSGLQVLEHGLARHHEVRAVVRNPDKMRRLTNAGIEIERADATDAHALEAAFTGCDAVVFTIGSEGRGAPPVMHEAMVATIAAARATGIRRLVMISASGHTIDGDDPLSRYVAKPIVKRILRDNFTDMLAAEKEVKASGLDWTIVRPPQLTERAGKGSYRSRATQNVRYGFQITRADLADAILDQLESEQSVQAVISVAN